MKYVLNVTGRLPANADGYVRCAEIIVNLQNRHVVEVLRVGFIQFRATKDGGPDREHVREVMTAAIHTLQLSNSRSGVVEAGHRFAKRRLDHLTSWTPTQAEMSKLREVVNRKAGSVVM